jgi:hypothetical protein
MKTITVNVNELAQEFREKHMGSDAMVCSSDGMLLEVRYYAPHKVYAGMYDSYGDMQLPDMDYYNGLTNEADIRKKLDELAKFLRPEDDS